MTEAQRKNINQATIDDLDGIYQMGRKRSEEIIQLREEQGKIESVDEIIEKLPQIGETIALRLVGHFDFDKESSSHKLRGPIVDEYEERSKAAGPSTGPTPGRPSSLAEEDMDEVPSTNGDDDDEEEEVKAKHKG